jgi:chemotaxis signal transduction protein
MYDIAEMNSHQPAPWQEIRQLLQRVQSGIEEQQRESERGNDTILRDRARQYGQANGTQLVHASEREDLVLFTLGNDTYGMDCGEIEEVIPLQNLVALPHTGKGILGISSLRGLLFAVIDLKRILNIPASELTTMHRVLIVRHPQYKVGFLVDSVQGMRSYGQHDIQELPPEVHERSRSYLQGLVNGSIMLISGAMVLQDPMVVGEDRAGS